MPKLRPGTIWPEPAKADLTEKQIDKIAATDMTFDQVEEEYGEEIAIRVGIARDPDTHELTTDESLRMRPASEVAPHIVAAYRRGRGNRRLQPRSISASVSMPISWPTSVTADAVGRHESTIRCVGRCSTMVEAWI